MKKIFSFRDNGKELKEKLRIEKSLQRFWITKEKREIEGLLLL